MPETSETNYQSIPDMDRANAPWRKFFVQLEGKTNGAHQDIVRKLKGAGHIEVNTLEESDYRLLFCPVVSRVGTDVSEALENVKDGKQTILVVMHHTFDASHVVAASRRLVEKPNVVLTVDCLFYEGKLLNSNRNDIAWFEIHKLLGVPEVSPSHWLLNYWKPLAFVISGVVVVAIITSAIVIIEKLKNQ